MEALAAVSVALLTVYDMCKAVDKQMRIGDIVLLEKTKSRCRQMLEVVSVNLSDRKGHGQAAGGADHHRRQRRAWATPTPAPGTARSAC